MSGVEDRASHLAEEDLVRRCLTWLDERPWRDRRKVRDIAADLCSETRKKRGFRALVDLAILVHKPPRALLAHVDDWLRAHEAPGERRE